MPAPDTPIEKLKNLGPASTVWLREAGFATLADLERAGPVLAYKIVKHRRPAEVNRLLLYALYGALHDVHWNALPRAVKKSLSAEADGDLEVRFEPRR